MRGNNNPERGENMYQIDDVVVYGLHGVCRITEIERKEFAGEEQLYYTMKPIFDNRSTFFVPAENEASCKKMRNLLTPEEIKTLVETIPTQKILKITDEKHRKDAYQKIIESGDRGEIMRLVKTLYKRRDAQLKAGKKQHLIDERFMKEAETVLFDEFAYVLHLDRANVATYILEELEE